MRISRRPAMAQFRAPVPAGTFSLRSSIFFSAVAAIVIAACAALAGAHTAWLDITAPAGLSGFRNTQGTATKDYIIDSIGGGCAFIDYDGDGRMDILLVRGSTLARL